MYKRQSQFSVSGLLHRDLLPSAVVICFIYYTVYTHAVLFAVTMKNRYIVAQLAHGALTYTSSWIKGKHNRKKGIREYIEMGQKLEGRKKTRCGSLSQSGTGYKFLTGQGVQDGAAPLCRKDFFLSLL